MVSERTRWSLAARISLTTFVTVGVTVLAVVGLSFWGVNHLVSTEHDTQIRVLRRLVVQRIDEDVAAVDRSLARIASIVEERKASSDSLVGLPTADAARFASLSLVDVRGVLLTSEPAGARIPPPTVMSRLATAPAGGTTFVWEGAGPTGDGTLWAVRRASTGAPGPFVIGVVDLVFLRPALSQQLNSEGSVVAGVVDDSGRFVAVVPATTRVRGAGMRFGAGETTGVAQVTVDGLGTVPGTWGRLSGDTITPWRVVVFDGRSRPWDFARSALAPAGVALGVIGLAAIAFSVVFSRRLIGPLRTLERAAKDVAAGGYVRPIDVRRDDEIGQVADAFNDIGVRLNSLQDMARLLASAASTDDVLDACLNAMGHILSTGEAAILLADQDAAVLALARGRGLASPDSTLSVSMTDRSPIVECFLAQRPVLFNRDASDGADAIRALFNAGPERSGVVVPLTAGADALGVAVVFAAGRRQLTDSQVETVAAFSANAAVAIRTSHLFADEQRSRREAEALREVAELTVSVHDIGMVLRTSAEIASHLLDYDGAHVILESRGELGLGAPVDPEGLELLGDAWRRVADGLDGERAGDPFAYSDPCEVEALVGALGRGWTGLLFIPLTFRAKLLGALVLYRVGRPGAPSERDLTVARSLAQQLALAMRNAHLFEDARKRAEDLETVFRISQTVSSELQAGVVLNRVLDVVQKILSADAVSLMSLDEARGRLETSMARGVISRAMLTFKASVGEDIPGGVAESGAPVLLGGLSHRPTEFASLAADEGLESLLAVPLVARGRSTGVLSVFSKKRDAFSAGDMELLLTFASQAALALDTAALYGREHHIATVLQQSILPEDLPQIPGLDVASFYLPSGREAEIGGDYYDLFRAPDGRIAIVIGDVCGKGVKAATKTSMVKYTVRSLIGVGLAPSAVLSGLNRELFDAGDPSDIVTIWLGLLDVAQGALTYASGGHPAGLVLRAGTDDIERLGASGPLLGAVRDAHIDGLGTSLRPGDLLLLCTDGVTEARSGTMLFGEGRVRRVLRSCSDSAAGCVDLLLQAVSGFASTPLRDDAAALVVRLVDSP